MRAVVVLCLIAGTAAAGPSRLVGGQKLAVLEAEPTFDEGTFVAPARSALAKSYRDRLVTSTLDENEKKELKLDALPQGLFVVRIQRDEVAFHQRRKAGAITIGGTRGCTLGEHCGSQRNDGQYLHEYPCDARV